MRRTCITKLFLQDCFSKIRGVILRALVEFIDQRNINRRFIIKTYTSFEDLYI